MAFPAGVFILQKSIEGIEICWNKLVLYVKLQVEKSLLGACIVVGKKRLHSSPLPCVLTFMYKFEKMLEVVQMPPSAHYGKI